MQSETKTKAELRKIALANRKALGANLRQEKSRIIAAAVEADSDWRKAKIVCIYVWFNTEVQTDSLIESAWKEGKTVCVPLCGQTESDKIRLIQIDSFGDLSPGKYGIREPSEEIQKQSERTILPENVDAFLVPGVAFDRNNNRLGWGGGYYDWLLSRAPQAKKIALAFERQIVEAIPTEEQDVKMSIIYTENAKR